MCVVAAVCTTPYSSNGVCMFGHSPLRWFGVQRGFYIYLLDPEREPGYKQMVLAAARVSVVALGTVHLCYRCSMQVLTHGV